MPSDACRIRRDTMNPINVIMEHKPCFKLCQAKAEKIIRLSEREFERFLQSPMEYQNFIKENVDLMRQNERGVYHCLLVTGDNHRDGILVEADGYDYARYASYVPDAAAFLYDSLSEMGYRLAFLVEQFITKGLDAAQEGYWEVSFDEIREQSGLKLGENPFLQELMADMIAERPDAAEVCIRGDCFGIRYRLEQIHERQKEKIAEHACPEEKRQRLGDLIRSGIPADTYLVHESDVGFVPVGRIGSADLDSGVLAGYADLLDARIAAKRQGSYGQEIELEGVPAERLEAFDRFLSSSFAKRQEMEYEVFARELEAIRPCSGDAAAVWYEWAKELEGYDKAGEPKVPGKTAEVFLNEFMCRFRAIRERHGDKVAGEMVSLAEHRSCIFPWEMERAAEHLAAGGGVQDILPMSTEGLLEGCPDRGQEETPIQSM